MAQRRIVDIFRAGERDISAAIRAQTACWGIEDEMLIKMRARGVEYVGVKVRETGDRYVTSTLAYFDRTQTTTRIVYRGGMQRFLPFDRFAHSAGRVKL